METITTYGVGPDQPTYNQLREQNRVLREALQEIASDIKGNPKRKQMLADDDFWAAPGEHTLRQWIAQAALTATSQPTAAEVHQRMFDHGDATSQEGQHEAAN